MHNDETLDQLLLMINQLREENSWLKQENEFLKSQVSNLESRLAQYENAHTPPSLRRGVKRKQSHFESDKGTPGQKKGHLGQTRPLSKPDRVVDLTKDRCPDCGSKLGKPFNIESKIIEDIPEPQPISTTEYRIAHYICSRCHKEVTATDSLCPKEGRFGNNVIAQVALLKYEDRLPHRKIQNALKRHYGFTISPATILDLTRRAADAVQSDYEAILSRIRNAKILYVDETSIDVQGKNYWLWVFTTPIEAFVAIRYSRGTKVLNEVLTRRFKGTIVCDGWKPYAQFSKNLQRCWAHLLRESKELTEKVPEAFSLHRELTGIYDRLNQALSSDPPPEVRRELWIKERNVLRELTKNKYKSEKVNKFIGKISNGFEYWLTFVIQPDVEPTNNRAERAIREHVVQRKIIGTLRSEKGTSIHERIMTMVATWSIQGLNSLQMMRLKLGS